MDPEYRGRLFGTTHMVSYGAPTRIQNRPDTRHPLCHALVQVRHESHGRSLAPFNGRSSAKLGHKIRKFRGAERQEPLNLPFLEGYPTNPANGCLGGGWRPHYQGTWGPIASHHAGQILLQEPEVARTNRVVGARPSRLLGKRVGVSQPR